MRILRWSLTVLTCRNKASKLTVCTTSCNITKFDAFWLIDNHNTYIHTHEYNPKLCTFFQAGHNTTEDAVQCFVYMKSDTFSELPSMKYLFLVNIQIRFQPMILRYNQLRNTQAFWKYLVNQNTLGYIVYIFEKSKL